MWRRAALAALAVPFATTLLGVGTAHAATIDVNPASVAPGGTLTIVGDEWFGTVTFVFVKGNTVLQAGNASTGPNGGPISTTRSAPTEPGDWQLCADGQNILDGAFVSLCTSFTVTPPPTTTAKPTPTTAAPTTTLPSTSSTTSTTSSTTVPETSTTSSIVPPTLPPTVPEPSAPPTSPVVTVPGGVDGATPVEEEPASTDGGGLSGLTIGLIVGVVALAGVGVVGLLSSGIGGRPRPAGAIGVGVVGAVIAGALAIAMPPPEADLPELAATRVQVSGSVGRSDSPSTITAVCPAGQVVIGGGYRSTWASATIDDTVPLIGWMDTYRDVRTSERVYVYPRSWTTRLSSTGDVTSAYWRTARVDGTVHFADFVWPSGQRSWGGANVEAMAGATVPWSPVWAAAMRDIYYRVLDQSQIRQVGVLVSASAPVEQGWQVSLQLPRTSLQSSIDVQVVAICAPITTDPGADGIVGAHIVTSAAGKGPRTATCPAGERALAVGWRQGVPGGVSSAAIGGDGASVVFGGDVNNTGTAVTVCAPSAGLEVTTASASGGATGGTDGSVTARCSGSSIAVSGGATLLRRTVTGDVFGDSHTLIAAVPTGGASFGVGYRALLRNEPFGSTSAPLNSEAPFVSPLASFTKVDTSTVEVVAVCARRVVAGV